MEKFIPLLKTTKLFSGIGDEEMDSMLHCLDAAVQRYAKGDYVFRQGEGICCLTLLAEGRLHIQKEDYWGNLSILKKSALGKCLGRPISCLIAAR